MKNMKLLGMLALLFVGLQINVLQAADYEEQEMQEDKTPGLMFSMCFVDGVAYPYVLKQGFDVLKSQDNNIPLFEDFIHTSSEEERSKFDDLWENDRDEYYRYIKGLIENGDAFMQAINAGDVNRDERDTFDESLLVYKVVSNNAQDFIVAGVKDRFLQVIKNAIDQKVTDLNQIQDPIFRYVMQVPGGIPFIMHAAKDQKWFDRERFGMSSSLLIGAVESNLIEIIKLLLAAGVNKEVRNFLYGYTALELAAANNLKESMQLLLAAGADTNGKNFFDGTTSLHWAVKADSKEAVQLLLDAGADITIVDFAGKKIEQYAETPEMQAIFEKAKKDREQKRVFENQLKKDFR